MISVDTKGGAIALLVVALILLGTWGARLPSTSGMPISSQSRFLPSTFIFFVEILSKYFLDQVLC